MKRVAIVAQGLSNGGAEKVASIIANYLASHQYDILFICAYSKVKEYNINIAIKVINLDNFGNNKILKAINRNIQIYKIIKEYKAEIVISFITKDMFYTVLHNVPVIFSLRNDPARIDSDFLSSHIREYDYKHSKRIVFQTEEAKYFFDKSIQERGIIIDNPLQTDQLPQWNPSKKTFVTACRLNKQKNLPLLIQAFILFHRHHPDYQLEIYGDGPLAMQLSELIYSNHAENFIFLKGRTNDIYKIMSEASVFVLTSDFEGVSNSMLEALCIGIPCICTDCPPGGARMFIKNNLNGYLVPVGNKEELVERMEEAILNLDKFKNNIYRIFELRKRLNVETICEKWVSLLEEKI